MCQTHYSVRYDLSFTYLIFNLGRKLKVKTYIQGIRKVIYMSDKYHEKITMVASRRLLDMAKIAYEQHDPKIRKLNIDFDSMNC